MAKNDPVLFERDEKHCASTAQLNDSAPMGIASSIEFFVPQIQRYGPRVRPQEPSAGCTRAMTGGIILAKFHKSLW